MEKPSPPKFISPSTYQKLLHCKNKIESIPMWKKYIHHSGLLELVPYLDQQKRISRAFYKLNEILHKHRIPKSITNILCLCEAPGGFVEAILFYFKNPNIITQSYKQSNIQFSKRIPNSIIDYGPIGNGDITQTETIKDIIQKAQQINKFQLITADGGLDIHEQYENQEQLHSKLIFCEVMTAIHSLAPNGCFILKMYDCFTQPSLEILWILEKSFLRIHIEKPFLSRSCNSEKYIICLGFKSPFLALKHPLPNTQFIHTFGIKPNSEFIERITRSNENYAQIQLHAFQQVFDCQLNIDNPKWLEEQQQKQSKISNIFLKSIKIHNHPNWHLWNTNQNYAHHYASDKHKPESQTNHSFAA
jgi:23S rRNA U2552 (ribose-2'-O)-methylase RlmE/FtsJ